MCGGTGKNLHARRLAGLLALKMLCARVEAPTRFDARSAKTKPVMTKTTALERSQIPTVKSILEKAKQILPNPYPWQIWAWEHLFAEKSRDVLVIAGTGSGKSFIFQCLHFVREDGISLIISPLSALMRDQVL